MSDLTNIEGIIEDVKKKLDGMTYEDVIAEGDKMSSVYNLMEADGHDGSHHHFTINDVINKLETKPNFNIRTANKSYLKSDIQSLVNPIIKNYSIKRFYGFDNNPKLRDVKKGIELLKDFKPDMIISIGGGSVIDMGKLINILSQNTNSSELIKNNIKLKKSKLKMVAIPTTSGTGSESTSFAVVYINNKKYCSQC